MSNLMSSNAVHDEQFEQFKAKIGEKIKALRINKGFSQKEAAKRAGLHPTYLNHVESGRRNFSLKILYQICKALGGDPSEILRDTLTES